MKLEIDIDDVAAKEIAKKDRKIERLQNDLKIALAEAEKWKSRWREVRELEQQIMRTAETCGWWYDDD